MLTLRTFASLGVLALAACAPRPAAPPPASPAAPTAVATAASSEEDAGVPIAATDPTWGDRLAPVTIVEFADFECHFCARAEITLKKVRDAYGPGLVRMVWKNNPLPFHEHARPAAEAAAGVYELAGSDAFWKFHDLAFTTEGELGESAFVAWAREVGVKDADAFRAGLRSHRWAAPVDRDLALAKTLGARGTPWFFVNGVEVEGAQPFENFQIVVEEQVAAARAKKAAGTPADRVYAVLSAESIKAHPPEVEKEQEEEKPDTKTVFRVPVDKAPARGRADAPVTIVEFADYQCPYCQHAEATMSELRADYGDKLRFVFRNEPLPFHPRAEPAAEAALEVRAEKGDDAFWKMHDALLTQGQDLGDDALVTLAASLGASADKVKTAIAKRTHQAEIDADAMTADDFGATGTPHFFINGRRLVGAQPKGEFAAIIDEELPKAEALVRAGTKPAAIYDALTKDGQKAPEPEKVDATLLPDGDPARGPATARVTIHEFADFECPYCQRAEGTMQALAKLYGAKVRFVWHDLPLPFHGSALPAARTAREARAQHGDAAFWAAHDKFFAEGAKLERADLEAEAKELKLDLAKWTAAIDGDTYRAELDRDSDAADKLGFHGTPSFVVVAAGDKTGYSVVGAQGLLRFRRVVDLALGAGSAGARK